MKGAAQVRSQGKRRLLGHAPGPCEAAQCQCHALVPSTAVLRACAQALRICWLKNKRALEHCFQLCKPYFLKCFCSFLVCRSCPVKQKMRQKRNQAVLLLLSYILLQGGGPVLSFSTILSFCQRHLSIIRVLTACRIAFHTVLRCGVPSLHAGPNMSTV